MYIHVQSHSQLALEAWEYCWLTCTSLFNNRTPSTVCSDPPAPVFFQWSTISKQSWGFFLCFGETKIGLKVAVTAPIVHNRTHSIIIPMRNIFIISGWWNEPYSHTHIQYYVCCGYLHGMFCLWQQNILMENNRWLLLRHYRGVTVCCNCVRTLCNNTYVHVYRWVGDIE